MSTQKQAAADSCLKIAERVGSPALTEGFNFVFSPLSIRAALSLAAIGSNGQTLNQFLSFLGSPTVADLNSAATDLLSLIRSDLDPDRLIWSDSESDFGGDGSDATRLTFVNGIWVDKSMSLTAAFKEVAENVHGAVAESVDFTNQAHQVKTEVNGWVERATNGLIKDLVPPASVNRNTRVILASALHFSGIWSEKFDKSETTDKEFHLLDGNTVQVPFMTSKEDRFIASFDGFKVLRLPYLSHYAANKSFSMLIFLPDEISGVHNLLQMAVSDPNFFNHHVPTHEKEVGNFMIPKFKFSSGLEEASEILKSLGLELPFSEQADFKEMVLDSGLYISSVHHKATIEVEEEGTTASAATVVDFGMGCCLLPPEPKDKVDFVADHPFMFAIREAVTGALLFVGHVADPSMV